MPFVNVLPDPKIYDKKLSEKTMKYYAWLIGNNAYERICFKCKKVPIKFRLHIHHKNKNRWDNRLNNLVPLCAKCHHSTHYPNGMTVTFKGRKHKLSSRLKIREYRLGKKLSMDTRRKLSIARKGRKFSDVHKKRISEALIKFHRGG